MLSRSHLHEYRIFNGITAFACHYSNCIILIGNFAILVKIVIMKTIQTMSHSHTLIDAIVWLSRAFHIYTVRTPKHVPLKCCRCHSAIQIRAYFRHVQYMNDEYVNRREHIHVISAAFHCQITIRKREPSIQNTGKNNNKESDVVVRMPTAFAYIYMANECAYKLKYNVHKDCNKQKISVVCNRHTVKRRSQAGEQ